MKITIKKIFNNFLSDQRGFALVMVAAGMVALMGFAALVTDVGMLVLNKSMLSKTVDAAALAGAQELPVRPATAISTATYYALQNGYTPETPWVSPYDGCPNTKITVRALKEVQFTFAKVLGIRSATVSAQATARIAGLTSHKGVAPLAIPNLPFSLYSEYTLKYAPDDDDSSPLGPGTYGALSLGGNGADIYEENLKNGYDQNISIGDIIDTETGNMSNPTKRAIDFRIDQCKHYPPCTYNSFEPGCSRVLIIPIYEPVEIVSGQIKKIRVVGFAAFFVENAVKGQGNECFITGRFVRIVADGDSSDEQTDFGVTGVKLIE